MSWLRWLIGYDRFRILPERPERLLSAFVGYNLPIWGIRKAPDGTVEFSCFWFYRSRVLALAGQAEIGIEHLGLGGLARIFYRYRRRWGIPAGLVLCFLFLQFAAGHVWQIRLADGPISQELLSQLAQAGLREGMEIRDFDNGSFCAQFLAQNPQYSYVSAGIHGATAVVGLNPRVPQPPIEENTGGANLVAGVGGVILRCEALYGQIQVNHGDTVVPGQLLVSGVVEGKNGIYRIENARGKVFARTQRTFRTTVSLQQEEKRYTGRESVATWWNILGKTVKIFDFGSKKFPFYDTIENREELTLPGGLVLPVSLTRVTYAAYELHRYSITPQRAQSLAYDAYHRFLQQELSQAQVVSEQVQIIPSQQGVELVATVELIENIAQSRPFTFQELFTP